MKASVIVCTYRRDEDLINTVSQLIGQNEANEYEILIVDQKAAHSEAIRRKIDFWSKDGKIRYYNFSSPGLTKARNFGAKEAKENILVYIDDDVILCTNFVSKHLAMYQDNMTDAVAGFVLDASGKKDLSHGQLHGTNFSVRRNVYFEVGGADENLKIHSYTEDIIFSERLKAKNKTIKYCSRAFVKHLITNRGGCRITDNTQITDEWEKSFSRLYLFYLRGAFKGPAALKILWAAFRDGPLRKKMVIKLWLQPYAWFSFVVANIKAIKAAKRARL